MATITRLVQGKKNPNRVNLYLDEQFAFALSIDEVAKNHLRKGLELTQSQIDSLLETDQTDYVYSKILNFLSFRPRTVKEVRDRLKKYKIDDKSKQDEIIARLTKNGYLSDLAFAEWFIASRNTHRPRSPRMLEQELRSKGVEVDVIRSVIDQVSDARVTIYRILDKKYGERHVLEQVVRQKIYGYLARQGFSWDKIIEVVKSWESE